MEVRAEFTTEPFRGEGEPPAHVRAAADALAAAGLAPDLGPFGTSVDGEAAVVLPALGSAMQAAFASGATRFTLQVEQVEVEQPQRAQPAERAAQGAQAGRDTTSDGA